MKLPPREYKALQELQLAHESGLSVARSISRNWKRYLFLLVYLIGFALFFWWADSPFFSTLFVGALLGIFLSDVSWMRLHKRLWSLSERITDWESVRALLTEHQSNSDEGTKKPALGPFEARDTYVHLGARGAAVPIEVTESFWEQLGSGALAHLGPGRLLSSFQCEADWSSWERHPHGEEVVMLIAGDVELLIEQGDVPLRAELTRPGSFVLVPRGAWHTANVRAPSSMLFITEGEGTEHRSR